MLLHGRGYDDEVVAAGALHDVVEKTPATIDDIAARFGSRVANLVAAVSDPPGIDDYGARKAALRDQVAHASARRWRSTWPTSWPRRASSAPWPAACMSR